MIKSLLKLLAASANFVALLLVANTAMATPQISDAAVSVAPQAKPQYISLNRVDSELKFTTQQTNPLGEHLGCSCSLCTQVSEQLSSHI